MSRRRKQAAAGTRQEEVESLRAALLEQEVGRVSAEAKVEELEAQVRVLESQSLREKLHLTPREREGRHEERRPRQQHLRLTDVSDLDDAPKKASPAKGGYASPTKGR